VAANNTRDREHVVVVATPALLLIRENLLTDEAMRVC
jgi:hypothetical protein